MVDLVHRFIVPTAYELLPPKLGSSNATAMLLATAGTESEFKHRKQMGDGPARGLWQFEKGTRESKGGVTGVILHPASTDLLAKAMVRLRYGHIIGKAYELHYVIEDNDVLACVVARLLLWTLPQRLPTEDDVAGAFKQYLDAWRPGAYKHGTEAKRREIEQKFVGYYANAWERVRLTP